MSRKSRAVVVGVAIAAWLMFAGSAFGAMKIYFIYYNSPGSDTGSNASLNAEYITIQNTFGTGVWMTNWTVKDAAGHTYKFGSYKLCGGCKVRIHTGKGASNYANRYWNQSWYIWNNTGDTAYLRGSGGTLWDSCHYAGTSAGYAYC